MQKKIIKRQKLIKLERNYRCSEIIVESASHIIQNNTSSKRKSFGQIRRTEKKIRVYEAYDAPNEAKFIADEIRKLRIGDRDYRDFTVHTEQMLSQEYLKMR